MPSHIGPGFYNPLGLRALYLSAPGIRIHGTAQTWSMGHRASHGCIRLTNHNILDLYPRVKVGTPVYIVK
jgi:lipoprotein-anchoring transpeptidase ErfK/SrfK